MDLFLGMSNVEKKQASTYIEMKTFASCSLGYVPYMQYVWFSMYPQRKAVFSLVPLPREVGGQVQLEKNSPRVHVFVKDISGVERKSYSTGVYG